MAILGTIHIIMHKQAIFSQLNRVSTKYELDTFYEKNQRLVHETGRALFRKKSGRHTPKMFYNPKLLSERSKFGVFVSM